LAKVGREVVGEAVDAQGRNYGRNVGSEDDDIARVNQLAQWMEETAERLERTMPNLRAARAGIVDLSPGAARLSHFVGSSEELGVAALEGYGFERVERARRRLLAALHEPIDDFQPDQTSPDGQPPI
jgi:hypothetical protein